MAAAVLLVILISLVSSALSTILSGRPVPLRGGRKSSRGVRPAAARRGLPSEIAPPWLSAQLCTISCRTRRRPRSATPSLRRRGNSPVGRRRPPMNPNLATSAWCSPGNRVGLLRGPAQAPSRSAATDLSLREGGLHGRRVVVILSGAGRNNAPRADRVLIDGHRPPRHLGRIRRRAVAATET